MPCNQVELQEFSQSGEARTVTGSHGGGKNNNDLEKEVLEALFTGAERFEEVPKITRRFGERRARVDDRSVFKSLEDPFQERVVTVIQSLITSKEDDMMKMNIRHIGKQCTTLIRVDEITPKKLSFANK